MGRLLLGTSVFAGALMTAAGALAPFYPAADFANHFRPYALAGCSALLAVAAAARAPQAMRWSAILISVNAALFALPLLWSAETAGGRTSGQALAAGGHREITIVTFNIMAWEHRPIGNVVDFLLREDADIVFLQEITQWHAAAFRSALKARYPHTHGCHVFQGCTQAIFAKRPWVSVQHVYRASGGPEMIWALFDDAELGRFRVHGLHMALPFTPEKQARHIDRLIARAVALTEPAIFAGDFNMTPWAYQHQRLLASAGLRRHGTFLRTWPADGQFRLPWPAFMIDHVLTTPGIRTVSIETGPNLGSDHLPVIARLRLP